MQFERAVSCTRSRKPSARSKSWLDRFDCALGENSSERANHIVRCVGGPYERPTEKTGEVIGPCKLLQEIGQGGFGVVYMAEQQAPVRRKVALKIITPGMDTREVIARFEAERQALAMMDHPNIAKVFDAGTTPTGRPYFVMELVKGTDSLSSFGSIARRRL
jgi:hypothetical protein